MGPVSPARPGKQRLMGGMVSKISSLKKGMPPTSWINPAAAEVARAHGIDARVRVMFNPTLASVNTMIPGLVAAILMLSIMAVMATATVFSALGWASGTPTKVIATLGIAALIVVASVLGYHTIMRLQSILTWITGAITVVYMALTLPRVNWSAVAGIPAGDIGSVIGALTMVMTGFGLGWINIAADWSRYQRRDASGSAIVFWNTFGASVAPIPLVIVGLLLAGSAPALSEAINSDPLGALASILPIWYLIPYTIVAVLGLMSGSIMDNYSNGLALLSFGVKLPRTAAAGLTAALTVAGVVYVTFFSDTFIGPFQGFLTTLGVPMAVWAGMFVTDVIVRKNELIDERKAEVEQPEQQRQGEQDDHHPEDGGADGANERDPRQDADPAVGVSAAEPAGQPGQDETGEGDRAVHELDDRVLEPADLQLRGDLIGIARRPRGAGGTRVGGAHHRAEQDRDEDQAHGPGTELGQSGVVH